MTGLVKSNVTYSFTYNDEGIRTTKTKGGVTTTYYLSGSQIIGEETNGNITLYVYDSAGAPLGMQYHAASYAEDVWDVYWFEKNLLGDVVALYDEAGTKLITYTYDAHGRCWRMQHNGGYSTTAMNNPFRYRGYYYDSDLELYVLNSRYYDPYTGRFISPDDVSTITLTPNALTDKNLYAYCDNNPIMRRDDSGMFWETVFDVVSLAFSVADVIDNPDDIWAWVGLVGDVVDLIPFVSGMGEAADIVRVATKVDDFVDAVDDVHDTAKAIDRIGDGLDTSSTVSKATKTTRTKGWQVGDDISNLTKAGNEPSWTTVRQRYWKNQAALNDGLYNSEDLHRMKKGLAPIREGAPMELHHPFGRKGSNFYIFEPVTKSKHHFIHYGW